MRLFRCSGCGSVQRRPVATNGPAAIAHKRCILCRARLEPIDEPEEEDRQDEPGGSLIVDDESDEDEPSIEDLGIHVERYGSVRSAAHLAPCGQLRTSLGWVDFNEEVTIDVPTEHQWVSADQVERHLRELGYSKVRVQMRQPRAGGG